MQRALTASRLAQSALRTQTQSSRPLAISATVPSAPDTSGTNFPAPSHVSLSGDAADIARQLREFYASADSSIALTAPVRAALAEELAKRAMSIPDTNITAEWIAKNVTIPEAIRLGDNPIFKAHEKK
jgi:hypothetical protein